MVTHDLESLVAVCDRVAALADGKVVAVGPAAGMRTSEHPWVKAYFGGRRAHGLASPGAHPLN
jgi:phospholipid/cholesterol/gamma-HCH transport system ATP-binding protein